MAAISLAAAPSASIAQQKSAKDLLTGAWTLLLIDGVKDDGTHVPAFGPNPDGMLMFSPNGLYAVQIDRANLPKLAAKDREKGTAEENKAIVQGSLAHYGTYALNEADKTFTLHVVASSFPNWDGTKQTRKITALTDDVLTYSAPPPAGTAAGGIDHVELVWRRAK